MLSVFSSLFPDVLSATSVTLLIAASFVTSMITAALGLGGGIALIAIMANIMPIAALVPVHGVVQLGSNAGRALVQIKHIDWKILLWFTGGAALGAALGGSIAINLPAEYLRFGIAVFILWIVWGKPPKLGHIRLPVIGFAGFAATLLSMFFGAAGPIGGSVLSTLGLSRQGFVANQAVTSLVMHIFKILAFGILGFVFSPWIGLIAFMIASGFLGTLLGSRLLGRMNESTFRKGFRVVLTLLALNLTWQSVSAFIS